MTPYDEDLHLLEDGELDLLDRGDGDEGVDGGADGLPDEERDGEEHVAVDGDLESLRDEFVDAYNARDAEALRGIVDDDVELPDTGGEGPDDLVRAVAELWDRSPDAVLTRGFCDDVPCAIAWRPEGAQWRRVAIVTFDAEDGLITVVEVPDDADALERATAEEPDGDELDDLDDDA